MNVELIKFVRMISNLTQADLAECVGVTQGTIARIENGTLPISPALTQKIKKVFRDKGINEYDLLLLKILIEKKGLN